MEKPAQNCLNMKSIKYHYNVPKIPMVFRNALCQEGKIDFRIFVPT